MTSSTRDAAVASALILAWAVWTLWSYWGDWPPDLSAVYLAARFFGQGTTDLVYASPARFFGNDYPAEWMAAVAALGPEGAQAFPYIYPPLWAAVLSPLAGSPGSFFAVALVWHVAAIAASVLMARGLWGQGIGPVPWALASVILLATSMISLQALIHSQPQITVILLILLSFHLARTGRSAGAGAALAVAAAIKLSPAALVLIFVVDRNWRAVSWFVVAGLALAVASVVLAGWPLHAQYLARLGLVADQLPLMGLNYSARALVFEASTLFGFGRPLPPVGSTSLILAQAQAWLGPLMLALGAVAVIAAWRATRGAEDRAARSPIAWAHYFLLVLLVLPGLLRGHGVLLAAAFAVLLSQPAILFTAPGGLPFHLHAAIGVALMIAVAAAFAMRPRG